MGTLYVVATPIGNLQDMSPRAVETLRNVSLIAAEDTRHSGALLKSFAIETPMVSYHHHNRTGREQQLLNALAQGDVAIITDAGTPAIADPGQEIVAAAHAAGYPVVPIPGASAVIAAVSASGLVSGPFIFLGFIERKGQERRQALGTAMATGWPIVLFESPVRLVETLSELEPRIEDRTVVIARELTKLHEDVRSGSVREHMDHYTANPPRGEVVMVIGGTQVPQQENNLEGIAKQLLADGLKPSRAARELAQIAGISGDEAYALIRTLGSR